MYPSLTDYIEKCCRYSFQDLGKVDGSSSLLVSADGSTIVMRKWENKPGENHPPTSTILTVNSGEEPVVLENCYANDVNADGTLVSGWWSLPNEKVLPESHFEWKEDKVNYNVTGRKLYKWSDQSSDESVSIYPGDNGYFFYNPCPYRWGKRPDIREPIADILKQQGVLPNDWILTSVDSISTNGVFLVGKGLYKGEVKGWLATIPRSHDDKPFEKPDRQSFLSWFFNSVVCYLVVPILRKIPIPGLL